MTGLADEAPSRPPRIVRPASARPATPHDQTIVVSLRDEALAEQGPIRGGALYAAREARSVPGADDPERPLWVGLLVEAVVGYLAASVEDLVSGDRLGKVDALYVDPRCRSVGVGEAMMEEALGWFRAQGCVGVDAIALPGARATKNFFEESGFTSRLLVMHHRL
jgi:ribosomal protein S18 acetylase RimI-like enzyme